MESRTLLLAALLSLRALNAAAAPACDASAAPEVPVIKGLAYDQARTALLAAGWQPGRGSKYVELSGNQARFNDRGYTELVSCDVATVPSCRFRFIGRGKASLSVITTGDENPLLDSKAVVTAAELGCQN